MQHQIVVVYRVFVWADPKTYACNCPRPYMSLLCEYIISPIKDPIAENPKLQSYSLLATYMAVCVMKDQCKGTFRQLRDLKILLQNRGGWVQKLMYGTIVLLGCLRDLSVVGFQMISDPTAS